MYYQFTDNMEDTDHMVYDQRVQNVTSDIYDNQRLFTGNISKHYVVQHLVWTNIPLYVAILHIIVK